MKTLAALLLMLYLVNAHRRYKELGFESHNFRYMNISRLETTFVDDLFDCSFACLQNSLCLSFNVAVFADANMKHWCELLPWSIYNNAASISVSSNDHSRLYSIRNPCASAPCMNNGTCLPMFREGTHKCTCHPGYFGDNCEIDLPECRVYDVLNEANRHQSYGRGSQSDGALTPGWYRFQSSSYTRMIDSCISHHRCSTDITGWLKGGEPAFEDGIVSREACFNGYYNCCYRRVQIRVRECQGFFVYELKPSPGGGFRYCAKA